MNGQEHRLINDAEQFVALFNYATIGIVVTDGDGKIVNFNKFAESQFGFSREELIGKSVDVLLPKAVQADHVKCREEYYESPQVRTFGHGRDLFAQTRDGRSFPVEVSLSHYTINEETFVIACVI